jgi:phage replication O-like protein O
MMPKKREPDGGVPRDWSSFPGFYPPRYTPTPDALFDWVMAGLNGAELKVLLYIVRRTFGFKKDSDRITQDQICNGITRADGSRLDLGTQLSRSTVQAALASLEQKQLIEVKRSIGPRGREASVYALRIVESEPQEWYTTGGPPYQASSRPLERASGSRIERASGGLVGRAGPASSTGPGLRASAGIQETANQQTEQQYDRGSNGSNRPSPPREFSEGGGEAELLSPRRARPYSASISRLTMDLSVQFHDQEHDRSNRGRALRLWERSGLSEDEFVALMYEARATALRAPNIEREARDGSPPGTKNRMPYWFAVLEDMVDYQTEELPEE